MSQYYQLPPSYFPVAPPAVLPPFTSLPVPLPLAPYAAPQSYTAPPTFFPVDVAPPTPSAPLAALLAAATAGAAPPLQPASGLLIPLANSSATYSPAAQFVPKAAHPQFEVLEPTSRVYRAAIVLDVEPRTQRVLVRYADVRVPRDPATTAAAPAGTAPDATEAFDDEYVPESWVEILDQRVANETFLHSRPNIGDAVHVRAGCQNTGALLWWEATVTEVLEATASASPPAIAPITTQQPLQPAVYCRVAFPDGDDEVVELARLRPAWCHHDAALVKQFWDAPEDIWGAIVETQQSLVEIAPALGLCSLRLVLEGGQVLEAIGSAPIMEQAKMALDVMYFRNAKEMARLQGLQKMLEAKIEMVKQKKESGYKLVFEVDKDVIGSCIGRGGVNLKKVHRLPGVIAINILEQGARKHRVEIIAETQQHAEEAREHFEHVRAKIYVSKEEIGPIIGRRGVHLRDIERKSGVSKFVLIENNPALVDGKDDKTPYFETVGTRKAIELATNLLNIHRAYLAKHKEMEDKVRKARSDLVQLGSSGSVSVDELRLAVSTPGSSVTNSIPPSPCVQGMSAAVPEKVVLVPPMVISVPRGDSSCLTPKADKDASTPTPGKSPETLTSEFYNLQISAENSPTASRALASQVVKKSSKKPLADKGTSTRKLSSGSTKTKPSKLQ